MSGDAVRELRKLLGWTQTDMARQLGLPDKTHVSKVESGVRKLKKPEIRLFYLLIKQYPLSEEKRRRALRFFDDLVTDFEGPG